MNGAGKKKMPQCQRHTGNKEPGAPITVTGMGIISSIGKNIDEFSESLRMGRSGIGYLETKTDPPISISIGAEITGFSFKALLHKHEENGLGRNLIQRVMIAAGRSPLGIQTAVISAVEAWKAAQLHKVPVKPDRVGLIIGGSNLTQNYTSGLYRKFQQDPEYLNPRYPLHYMDTDHVGTISEIFYIQGEGFTVGGASASGNTAIIKGCQLIRWGIADVCLVVGALADLSPMDLQGYYNLGAMGGKRFHDQPAKACRPFDREHEGFIYGQASACLVLESAASARQRGIPLLAEILGGSLILTGNRLADPCEDGEARAMESALNQANITANSIQYLNAHGTSSPLGDETEIKAIKKVFKNNLSRLWINSTKGLTGHCLWSAGVVESIATIIQMNEGFIHPNLNLENPIDSQCRFSGKESQSASISVCMSNSFGFGGINTSIVFKKEVGTWQLE